MEKHAGSSSTVRFAPSFLPGAPPDRVAEWCREAELLRYALVGIGDSPALYREPWVSLAIAAKATRTIRIGTWVTNPQTRHPVVTASAAASLDELAPGRVLIGIGSGNSAVLNIGSRASSVAALRKYVISLRELLDRGQTFFNGDHVRLNWTRTHVPIYISAHGLKTMHLAGELADGVIAGMGVSADAIAQSLDALETGARAAGRDVNTIDVWWYVRYLSDPRDGIAEHQALSGIVGDVAILGRNDANTKLLPEEHVAAIRKLAEAYVIAQHGKADEPTREAYVDLARRLGVADYLLDRYAIAGTPQQCIAKVRAAAAAGATQFTCSIRGDDRIAQLRMWSEQVMSQL